MSELRTNLVQDTDLLEVQDTVKIVSEKWVSRFLDHSIPDRTRTPGNAKDINQVGELIRQAIQNYEERQHKTEDAKIDVIYEKLDKSIEVETIAISFMNRTPGMAGQGSPMENKTKSLRPALRDEFEDPDNPGYKRLVLGYFYDNVLRLTCYARTSKAANERAIWLETLMEEFTWYFCYSGVNRILFDGWRQMEVIDVANNRYYGRPLDYYVRTEKLLNVSQKKLEEIVLRLSSSTA